MVPALNPVTTHCARSHLNLRILVLIFFTTTFHSAGGAVSTNRAAMVSVVKNLWSKIFGGAGQGHAVEGLQKQPFPDTLEGFGYHFNPKGELVDKKGGRFQFVIRKDDPDYNQRRYAALGEVVTAHLYNLMERDLQLEKVYVPVDAGKGDARSFIFRTRDAAAKKKLMVLIHGSGAVRAGQWSRKLIINENIDTGSQLPYIRRAISEDFGVIVMNPNLNEAAADGRVQKIRGSESPEQHGVYVWRHFVQPAKAQNIALVAHSYGGIVACTIAGEFLKDFQKRVFSVVFTDSVHTDGRALWSNPVKDFMKQRAVNFISAREPLNFKMKPFHRDDCLAVSAGTPEHERTSHACIDSAFHFIRSSYSAWINKTAMDPQQFVPQLVKFKSEL